jgi:magnesium chelatase family protein
VFRGLARAEFDCTEAQRGRYYAKISGPLLDRIDIQVEVPQVKFRDIVSRGESESSEKIRERVSRARERQLERFQGRRIYANAQMGTREIKKFCQVGNIVISFFGSAGCGRIFAFIVPSSHREEV